MQELNNSIKRPNLRRRRGASQRIHNIFFKKITDYFSNLGKDLPIQVQKAYRTPNR
jgi:hypothetical protein